LNPDRGWTEYMTQIWYGYWMETIDYNSFQYGYRRDGACKTKFCIRE
jgi:hypothetical protein